MVLRYYFDLLSQPSRAVYILLQLNDIPFEPCPVALKEGEHLTDDFKEKFSKFQKVPFIHDGSFKLTESIGIVRYLSREYPLEDHWYPRNSKRQALIDQYLEWQHLNIRLHCSSYFIAKWLNPMLTGREPHPKKLQFLERNMINSLEKFVEFFLADSPFINGQEISFADILAACEIEQTKMAGFDPLEHRPKLSAWMERVRVICSPFYDEAHVIVNEIAQETKQKIKAKL